MILHFVYWGGGFNYYKKLDESWMFVKNHLFSYHYVKKLFDKPEFVADVDHFSLARGWASILDSWAFSAFSKGSEIDINQYIDFIFRHKNYFEWWFYASLDVIWDAEKTLKNQLYMESVWLKPLPTYHYWEPIEYLHKYLEEYDYIGIWWLVPLSTQQKKIDAIFQYVFHYIQKHNLKTKIHWRGMTNPKFMIKYPFYSVDSSWRVAWWKFNRFLYFDDIKWVMNSYNATEYRDRFDKDPAKLEYHLKLRVWVEAYQKLEQYASSIHRVRWLRYRE